MLDNKAIDSFTLYPSKHWETFNNKRNIFNCTYKDYSGDNEFTLKCLCHYVQLFGDIKLRTIAEKLKRHLITEENFTNKKKSEINFIATHDEKLLKITEKIFNEVYLYTVAIKEKIEKMYDCRLELQDAPATFKNFLKVYFSPTEEEA